jgi:hypothetical protein
MASPRRSDTARFATDYEGHHRIREEGSQEVRWLRCPDRVAQQRPSRRDSWRTKHSFPALTSKVAGTLLGNRNGLRIPIPTQSLP